NLFLKELPDEIDFDDLKDTLDHNKFVQIARQYLGKEPTTYEKFKDYFSNSWRGMGSFFSRLFGGQEEWFKSDRYTGILKDLGLEGKKEIRKEDLKKLIKKFIGDDLADKY